jgi:hypothetical protein
VLDLVDKFDNQKKKKKKKTDWKRKNKNERRLNENGKST